MNAGKGFRHLLLSYDMQSQLVLRQATSIQLRTNGVLPQSATVSDPDSQCARSIRAYLRIFIGICFIAIASGCERSCFYRTTLNDDERIEPKASVLLDDCQAGCVKSIIFEHGNRIAILVLKESQTMLKHLKQGTVRVPFDDGQIHLRTDLVQVQSPLLSSGTSIPMMLKTGLSVRKVASNRMLTGLMLGLGLVALVALLFCRLRRGWGLCVSRGGQS